MTDSHRRLWLTVASVAVLAATPASAQSVIAFGDSLSDNGNLFAVTGGTEPPSPPYFQGRFSNGPVFTEILAGPMQRAGAASAAGQRIDPAASQNYAFGGARTDRAGAAVPGDLQPPGIPQQIDFFQAQDGRFASDDLVTLYGGANNIFQAFSAPGVSATSLTTASVGAADDIAASASRLSALGAPTLVVLNLPDLGDTPQFNGSELMSVLASGATTAFNARLAAGIGGVAAGNPATNLYFVDVMPLFAELQADPARFGFTNTTQGCLFVPSCASAPASVQNQFQYFDTVHPTAAGHALFAGLVSDYLTAGSRAADIGSLSETAFFDRLAGEAALRDRARLAATGVTVAPAGSDAMSAVTFGSAYLSIEGAAFDRDADGSASAYDYRSGTLRLGGDYRLSETLLLGGAVSAMQGDVDGERLDYDTQSFSADVFGTGISGPAYVTLSGGVSHFDFDDFRRQTAIAQIVNRAGHVDGFAANVGVEAGYAFALGAFTATPTLGLTYAYFDVDGFDESGAGANIVYGGYDRDALYGAANLHLAYATSLAGRQLQLTGRIGYEDALSDDDGSGVVSSIAGSPSRASFAAFEDLPGRGLILGAGARADITERLGLGADYSVGFGDEIDVSHIGRLSLNYRF